jgi:hypothetical protein
MQKDSIVASTFFSPLAPAKMMLRDPELKLRYLDEQHISITCKYPAWKVLIDANLAAVYAEDNYFDLLPNEPKFIRLSKPISPADVAGMSVYSLWNLR